MSNQSLENEENENEGVEFTELPSEDEVEINQSDVQSAVVYATDWTTETIMAQLQRENILLNPNFQRRDAWKPQHKSRFIESLIIGLPIPQLVLAEKQKGKFIVLDGKQRLLSIKKFWNNEYALSGLEVRKDLNGKKFSDILTNENDCNALLNQTIRTSVIRNWQREDFLHLVFLRLNTGSIKLSPQELRQALFPGPFSDWISSAVNESQGVKDLLKIKDPDFRMRDIEIMVRYFSFRFFLKNYQGRMKEFLDETFKIFNKDWENEGWKNRLTEALKEFDIAVKVLIGIFKKNVGRKPRSKHFNRAIFDFLIFYAREEKVRDAMLGKSEEIKEEFYRIFDDPKLKEAIERNTADMFRACLQRVNLLNQEGKAKLRKRPKATWNENRGLFFRNALQSA